jgi:hypothetical protein
VTASHTIADLRRELDKARITLIASQTHLAAHAEANAALHCATTVMYSPLHAQVTAAIQQIEHALQRTEQALINSGTAEKLASILTDLDRCVHGRHRGDDCGSCGYRSAGNPNFPPGKVIGTGLRGDCIVVPANADRHDPEAWRRPAIPEEPQP